jgi:6-pyruvoyltetrahydropterin/6-carboxytetrahydropterin synthase
MNEVTKQYRAEISHRLMDHPGACRNIHGHSYLFEITLAGVPDAITGMVMDFKDLKSAIEEVVGKWDHSLILEERDPLRKVIMAVEPELRVFCSGGPPTAEWMAEMAGRLLTFKFHLDITRVRVWETTTSYAEWTKEESNA